MLDLCFHLGMIGGGPTERTRHSSPNNTMITNRFASAPTMLTRSMWETHESSILSLVSDVCNAAYLYTMICVFTLG